MIVEQAKLIEAFCYYVYEKKDWRGPVEREGTDLKFGCKFVHAETKLVNNSKPFVAEARELIELFDHKQNALLKDP